MKKLMQLLKIIDDNLLNALIFLFIILIPLYPKLPLIFIEYTYIYIRFEDFFMVLFYSVFLIQLLRRKVTLNTTFLKYFIFFWGVVVASFIVGTFFTNTLRYHQVAELHSLRRFEYMGVFFVAASVIKSFKQFKFFLWTLFFTVLLVNIYGLGQRFWNFPSISTMNPAFATGDILYLTPEARINSTFAGHYDLAAFVVLITPVLWGIYFSFKNSKIVLFINIILSYLVLMYTASRTSIIAYATTPLCLLYMRKFKWAFTVIILSIVIFMFNKDLSKRISQTFQIKQIFVNNSTGQVYVPQQVSKSDLPAGGAIINLNSNKNNTKALTQTQKNDLLQVATQTGTLLSATDQAKLLANQQNFQAQSSVVADTSFSARLQIEWPRAINAFKKNPLLGTGASSITESTDGDYFRALGEFGLLGFVSFGLILYKLLSYIYRKAKIMPEKEKFILLSIIFGTFGLLLNAALIDVFEASKIAFMFWLIMGIYIGYLSNQSTSIASIEMKKKVK